jgi:hypothetical protein
MAYNIQQLEESTDVSLCCMPSQSPYIWTTRGKSNDWRLTCESRFVFLRRISFDLSFIHSLMAYDSTPCEVPRDVLYRYPGHGHMRKSLFLQVRLFSSRLIDSNQPGHNSKIKVTCSFCSNTNSLVQSLCIRVEYLCNHIGLQSQVALRKQSQFANRRT